MSDSPNGAYRIGSFVFRPERGVLRLGDASFHLEPKVCDVLCRLAKQPGDMVTREVLLDDVWGRSCGADESLTRAISILRRTFKADGERLYIETIPKRGYRLTAPVAGCADGLEEEVPATSADAQAPSARNDLQASPAVAGLAGQNAKLSPFVWLSAGLAVMLVVVTSILVFEGEGATVVAEDDRGALDDVVVVGDFIAVERDGAAGDAEFIANQLANRLPSMLSINGVRAVLPGSPAQPGYEMSGSVEANGDTLLATIRLSSLNSGEVVWASLLERPIDHAASFATEAGARFAGSLGCALGLRGPNEALGATLLARLMSICESFRYVDDKTILEHARALQSEDPNTSRALALSALLTERHAAHTKSHDSERYEALMADAKAKAVKASNAKGESPLANIAYAVTLDLDDLTMRDKKLIWSSRTQGTARTYALWRRGSFLRAVGRITEAITLYNTILLHDPYHPTASAELGWLHRTLGRVPPAKRFFTQALALDPDNKVAKQRQFMTLLINGSLDEASAALEKSFASWDGEGQMMACFSLFYQHRISAERGETAPEASLVETCRDLPPSWSARMLASLGQDEAAWEQLKETIYAIPHEAKAVLFYPEFENLRRERRFWSLFQHTGLPAYWLENDVWPDFCRLEDVGYNCRDVAEEVVQGDA